MASTHADLPFILAHPDRVSSVEAGSAGSLMCLVTGFPIPTVSWFRNGAEEILSDTFPTVKVVDPVVNGSNVQSVLEVCPFTSNLTGNYSCRALNFYGNATFMFQLQVNAGILCSQNCMCFTGFLVESPFIFDFPTDITVDIAQNISFTCSATGIPLPDVSWFKDGSPLDPNIYDITVNRMSSIVSSVLVLESLVMSSAGEYSCVASHVLTSTHSRQFNFTVESKSNFCYTYFHSLLPLLYRSSGHFDLPIKHYRQCWIYLVLPLRCSRHSTTRDNLAE